MTYIDERESLADNARACPQCGHLSSGAHYCPECGRAMDAGSNGVEAPTLEQHGAPPPPAVDAPPAGVGGAPAPPGGAAADPPPTSSSSRSRGMWIAAVAVLCLAAGAVAVVIVMSGSSSNQAAAYKQKLSSALAPVVSANRSLSVALVSVQGSNTGAATAATTQAQQAVVAAHGAAQILTVPSGSAQLSQQVQQALTDEGGYLQAVSATLSSPSSQNIAQLQPLATSVQSALVPLETIAPGASASIGGSDKLSAWASGRVSAAAKTSAAQQSASQQHAVQQAASKAAQQAVANSANSTSSAGSSAAPVFGIQGLPVQCGYGVAGSAGMDCTFANNAFYEYWNASGGDPSQTEYVNAWSSADQTYYSLSCLPGDGVVDCTGTSNSGTYLDARFTANALSAYTSSQATAYLASGKPGPNG